MKRLVLILLIFLVALFSGCTKNESEQSDKISIVCTIFPQYDWVRQIIGEENMSKFDLILLINSRIDLHSYNPSVQDIAKVSTSDVFIHIGGDSDNWVDAVLRQSVNADLIVVNLMEILGDLVIHDGHDHDEEDCEEDHEEAHEDEHIWLSLKNAMVLSTALAGVLSEIDPENAPSYNNNLASYIKKLSDLDAEYESVVKAADITTLVFADRFPFRYLTDDYGLHCYAAFSGCSAETEASFVTIISLANSLNQYNLNAVMVTESSDQSIARTVINNTESKNQKILRLDSMQSVTFNDVRNGVTYLSIMESNLNVLKEALK
jgi:zinc transport system substrate-binding protein